MLPEGYTVKRGDTLAVSGFRDAQYKRVKVARVTNRSIFLEDGSKYSLRGVSLGSFASSELHPLIQEIEAKIKREVRVKWLKEFPYDRMPDEFLDKLVTWFNQRGHDSIQ